MFKYRQEQFRIEIFSLQFSHLSKFENFPFESIHKLITKHLEKFWQSPCCDLGLREHFYGEGKRYGVYFHWLGLCASGFAPSSTDDWVAAAMRRRLSFLWQKRGGGIRKAKINLANTYDQWVSSTWERATIGSINSSNDRALPPETIPRLLEGNVHLRDV